MISISILPTTYKSSFCRQVQLENIATNSREELKRLWEQWTQHTVRGAFRPTILHTARHAVPLIFFKGHFFWPNGTPAAREEFIC